MDQYDSEIAPDAWSVLKFTAGRMRNYKWLIGSVALVLVAVVLAILFRSPARVIWTDQTKVTIGMAPPLAFVFQRSGPPLAPLEPPERLVARISAQGFKEKVAARAAFDPKTADVSRATVISSLRGIVANSDRDIGVTLSAGSPEDVRAAMTALTAEVGEAHSQLLKQHLQPLQTQIEDAKARIALIEKANDNLNERLLSAEAGDRKRTGSNLTKPNIAPTLQAWNELKDRIQIDENLTQLSEPTVVWSEPGLPPVSSRGDGVLRRSLVAGLVMLVAIGLLALAVSARVKS